MARILDTNALSAFADGDASLRGVLGNEPLAVPVMVLGEYVFGIRSFKHRYRYEHWLSVNSSEFLHLNVSSETAQHYADVRFELKSFGSPIPKTRPKRVYPSLR